MPHLDLQLNISADEMLEYYRGTARVVCAVADNGQTVNFPAGAVQRFVTEHGVHGRFRLIFDHNNKLLTLEPAPQSGALDQQA